LLIKNINNSDRKLEVTFKIVLYVLPILAILGTVIPLFFGKYNYSILGLYIAIPMILAPIIYLMYCRNKYEHTRIMWPFFKLLIAVYFLCYSFSIILLYEFEIRPYIYYILVTILTIIILLEILLTDLSNLRVITILFQIMILISTIIWGVTLKYYYFIGRTDPPFHVMFINSVLHSGFVTETFDVYMPFPLWHILVSCLYIILNQPFPTHKFMFFVNGVVYAFIIPVGYLVAVKLFENRRCSLLVSLFIVINSDVLDYGMASISRSVVSYFVIVLILLILSKKRESNAFLLLFITFTTILFHTASMPFIYTILCLILIFQFLYYPKYEDRIQIRNYMIVTAILTISYWIFNAQKLFREIIHNIMITAPTSVLTKSIVLTPANELFNYLQYGILLFFVILGILWVLDSKKSSHALVIFSLVALVSIPLAFPGPALLLNKLALSFNINRFNEYCFLFISTIAAVGFYKTYCRLNRHSRLILILLFAMGVFLSISNDFNASDNPVIKRPFYTYYITEEEITAIRSLENITTGYLMSDWVIEHFLETIPEISKHNILEVGKDKMNFQRSNENDIILIRNGELSKRPLKLYTSETNDFVPDPSFDPTLFDYYYNDMDLFYKNNKYNKIYMSGGVSGLN
jgi:hypothetical protein